MKLTIRVDDFPGTKPDEFCNHNLTNFKLFHDLMVSHSVKNYILGVIPLYTSVSDLRWLSNQPEITIALHGVFHDESHLDEFEGLSHSDIVANLNAAKMFLETTPHSQVSDYIPPHNTLSDLSIKCLSEAGFRRIYGGPETLARHMDEVRFFGMEYIHSNSPLEYGRSDELLERGSVEWIKSELLAEDHACLTLHWPWEFNIGLEYLDNYLTEMKDIICHM